MRVAVSVFLSVILAALLPISAPASAKPSKQDSDSPNGALLVGRVLDKTDAPVASATVLVLPADGGLPIAHAMSNAKGVFNFSDLPPGRYALLAIHGHHSPGRSGPVVVGQLGSPFPIRLTLEEARIEI